MKIRRLAIAWAFLYGVTAALGFVSQPDKVLSFCMMLLSVAFFVPGGWLVYEAVSRRDYRLLKIIRNVCLVSLISTMVVLVVNFLSYEASAAAGMVLYWLLILVSAPMICSQLWVIPLFGWACMLMVCLEKGKKKK
ncbi:MAG: hypothetical protein E7454_05625 [Ruminococcaceae bacterium]|nr:hypothetical protein [Oscillospiraceae bacterium]